MENLINIRILEIKSEFDFNIRKSNSFDEEIIINGEPPINGGKHFRSHPYQM